MNNIFLGELKRDFPSLTTKQTSCKLPPAIDGALQLEPRLFPSEAFGKTTIFRENS